MDRGQAQAWTGLGMAVRLLNRLGPRATVGLLQEFGEQKRRSKDPIASGNGLGRKDFLRLGTGAAVAVALVAMGKTPAFADPEKRLQDAQAWVKANPSKVPRHYGDLAPFNSLCRKVILQELPPADRGRLMAEHVLGPDPIDTLAGDCACSTESDWCSSICLYDGYIRQSATTHPLGVDSSSITRATDAASSAAGAAAPNFGVSSSWADTALEVRRCLSCLEGLGVLMVQAFQAGWHFVGEGQPRVPGLDP
ncbi:hypothetical protein [Flindersiella endophytica]